VDSLLAAVPAINSEVRREIAVTSATMTMKPEFREKIEQALKEMHDHSAF
jgi:hypothetical protein